jgi:thermitase
MNSKRSRLILAILAFAVSAASISAFDMRTAFAQDEKEQAAKGRVGSPFVPRRVLVRFRSEVSGDRIRGIVAATGALRAKELSKTGVQVVELPAGVNEEFFLAAFKARPDVVFAELDRVLVPAEMTPDDPSYGSQWHLPNISSGSAWVTTTGASNVVIAILDTGVDSTHPDLASKMVGGWNTYDGNSDTTDATGHGTSVAGAATAAGNNGIGVASVAWGCQIMPVRVSDPGGSALASTIATGLVWAADNGARVANISYECSSLDTVIAAAQYFQGMGGVVTVAAGNNGISNTTADNRYVLTSSATTSTDTVASWSNTGSNIDVAAPGSGIVTTLRGGGYGAVTGTSMSAPVVAGIAALVMSANSNLNPDQVQTIIKQSADDFGTTGWDSGFGWGRVNASRAVESAVMTTGTPDLTAPSVSMLTPGSEEAVADVIIIEAAAGDNVGVAAVTLSLDGNVVGSFSVAPYNFAWDTTTESNGSHTLSATATDFAGNSDTISISVTVANLLPGAAPPTISITSPRQNARVSGSVSVYVAAADDLAVTKVELYVDGALQTTSRSAPFTTKWDTKKVKAGTHTLQCKAYDGSGNSTMSAVVTVSK